ncbi:hypothetical protein [Marinicrinis sediminis]|uniref:Cytosolic protein n=1 Tax=Marinicrinis sediminis TaxID=1652465 RepID=A0ABW5RAZ4_9BACL
MADGFVRERRSSYTDVATVESQRNDTIPEEFPEGPYASTLRTESLGKSTPWRADQRPPNRFAYENRQLHAELPRQYPPGHHTHTKQEETEDEHVADTSGS